MSIILTDSQGRRYRLTHGWGGDISSNKNLFRGPGQAQAFIGELAPEQTTEIYQTFFGGTDLLPRHLCTPQANAGAISGPYIISQVRTNEERIADAIERSQLVIEKDNSLQPVADDRAILRVKIRQALNEILIAERAEAAKIDEEFQKLNFLQKDLALRWAGLKGLGGAAWDLAKWIKEVHDLTSMQLRLYRYAKNAHIASGTEDFYDTFTSLNLDAELRELIDVLGFDPTKVSLDDIKKALDFADQVTSDGPLMRDIGLFIKDFALSQHRLEVAEFGGAAAFEILLTAILTALTGGVGLGVAIASKARLVRQFEKLGKLLSEFAIANKKVGKYLADKAKRGAKSVKRSFDDVKTGDKAALQNNKPAPTKKPTPDPRSIPKRARPNPDNYKTYTTHGIQTPAMSTPEGRALVKAYTDQGIPKKKAIVYAETLLRSSSTPPRAIAVNTGEKLYKVVPEGATPGSNSAFFATESDIAKLKGQSYDQISDQLGIPLESQQTPRFDVVEVSAAKPTTVYQAEIAPTSQLGYNQPGGGTQTLILDRSAFTAPTPTGTKLP